MELQEQIIIDQIQKVLDLDASFGRKMIALEGLVRHGRRMEGETAMKLVDSASLPDVSGAYF